MALTTYTELKAAIADLIHRTEDLTTQIVDFVTLAEKKINRRVRTREMESDESVTLTSGARTIALPSRYLEPITFSLVVSGEPRDYLRYVNPNQLQIDTNVTTRPTVWTVNGGYIEVPNLSDATYSCIFRMLKGFDIASTSTNTLLTNFPDVYLYGAALEAAPYMMDDNRIPMWKDYFNEALQEVNMQSARSKVLSTLSSEFVHYGRTNILTGE